MVIYSIKPQFQRSLRGIERFFIKRHVSPTQINIYALILSIFTAFVIYFSSSYLWFLLLIPFLSFFRMALNALDGMVARTLKVKGQAFGEVLNEGIDRFSDVIMFGAFAMTSYVNSALGWFVVSLILLGSYFGVIGKAAGGKRQYVGLMGKSDRVFVLSVGAVAMFVFQNYLGEISFWTLVVLAIGMICTIFQRFFSIKKELDKK